MVTFRFWAAVIVAGLLGLAGFFLAPVFPLPSPITLNQTKVIYTLIGVLGALLIFAKIVSWIIRTVTRLTRLLILKLASEIINQLTHLASSGLQFLPPFVGLSEARKSYPLVGHSPVILDTSALIDGRILEVAKTGFIWGLVLIPDFVLRELQQVADSADDVKRQRGRRGFEVVDQLKKVDGIKVEVWDKVVAGKSVDDKLIKLGKILKGRILTADFNLNQVAAITNVKVLNLNILANSLKFLAVPGERLKVKVIQTGKDSDQGIGYLEDGTMVVVKGASGKIGETVQVEVNKNIQSPAGRMIFGKLIK